MEERRTRQCPPPPAAYPWLVFSHGRGFKNQTFHTTPHPPPSGQNKNNNSSSSVRSVPELRNKFVWNSCHGWLILSNNDDDDQFSLFNPVTLESVLLPPNKLDPETAILGCTLTFPPSNPNCTLFVFDRGLRRILFCRLENKKWIAKSYAKEIDTKSGRKHDTDCLHLPVCCKVSCPAISTDQVGEATCVYFSLVEDKSLYAYNIEDDSISVSLPCPSLPTPWKSPIWVMPDLRLTNEDSRKDVHMSEEEEEEEQKKEEEERGSGEEVVGKEDDVKKEAKERLNLLDLPLEILKAITGQLLMPVDYKKFRTVSTMTRQLAPHIEWRTAMSGSDRRPCSLSSPDPISLARQF
ncbi:hypothetical protein RHMOL_Rhmol06G0297300 [Rhododendron molle]|uniref:Uncharacterized protein n=1 Tax=Rhododendron molle TaxID=49168 RepID=A0ACC0NIS9_RHOML|nr:hypothetical protein RHMOL_Rhmol06G0297300 [Rhododendron molle]